MSLGLRKHHTTAVLEAVSMLYRAFMILRYALVLSSTSAIDAIGKQVRHTKVQRATALGVLTSAEADVPDYAVSTH